MFTRRFIRTKVFHALYSFNQDGKENRNLHLKHLKNNLDKTYELYIFLLGLPAAFKHFVGQQLDNQRNKYIPNQTAITELEAIFNNQVIASLETNTDLEVEFKKCKTIWNNNRDLFKHLLSILKQNQAFKSYATKSSHTYFEDKQILIEMYEVFIGESELFENYLEEKFISWNDDVVLVYNQVAKSIAGLTTEQNVLENCRLDDEENEFAEKLFDLTALHTTDYTELISSKTQNWDTERIALVDLILMQMALAEILHFANIPVKASINEYLELAKLYSTPSSHAFINGVLDKIQKELKQTNKLNKTGRGLVE